MSDEGLTNQDFGKLIEWAEQEEKARAKRGNGYQTFYLVVAACIILVIIFLFIIFWRDEEIAALNLMKDPDNIYEDEYTDTEGGDYEEGYEEASTEFNIGFKSEIQ
jgi:hypothetical protein